MRRYPGDETAPPPENVCEHGDHPADEAPPVTQPTPTLLQLLDVVASDYDDMVRFFETKEGKQAVRDAAKYARAASQRLRTEIAVWREVEPGMAYTGEVVRRCLKRINGDVQSASPLPTPTAPTCAEWCGTGVTHMRTYGGYCTEACHDAGHPLNPVQR